MGEGEVFWEGMKMGIVWEYAYAGSEDLITIFGYPLPLFQASHFIIISLLEFGTGKHDHEM